MIVIGFEDCAEGQKRIVVNDLVGGVSLRDADLQKFGAGGAGGGGRRAQGGQWTWIEDTEGGTMKRESRASRIRAHSPTTTTHATGAGGPGTAAVPMKFPPDGGTGMRAVVGYPWFPEEGEAGAGELIFPRWAEIREVEDVNGEWWAGVYAGLQGVFPGVCVRVI